jgi:hypothetical protein
VIAAARAPLALGAWVALVAGAATTVPPAGAPDAGTARTAADTLADWHFPVGERMEYSVTWGGIRLGEGSLAVEGLDTLDGHAAYRVAMEMRGGPPFYRVNDRMVSWIDPSPFSSLRFDQQLSEGSYRRDRRTLMDYGSMTYSRYDNVDGRYVLKESDSGLPIPPGALDDVSFLYFARLLPLEVGHTYEFERYFKEQGNPVILKVLRREEIRVPAGRFQTIVVQPLIRTSGMFGEGGEAEVWLTDDARRIPVRVKTSMSIGSGNLFLTGYEPGDGSGG